jgi:hypothetical protein
MIVAAVSRMAAAASVHRIILDVKCTYDDIPGHDSAQPQFTIKRSGLQGSQSPFPSSRDGWEAKL